MLLLALRFRIALILSASCVHAPVVSQEACRVARRGQVLQSGDSRNYT